VFGKCRFECGRVTCAYRRDDRIVAVLLGPAVLFDQLAPEYTTADRKAPHVTEDLHDQPVRTGLENGDVKFTIELVGVRLFVFRVLDVVVDRLEPADVRRVEVREGEQRSLNLEGQPHLVYVEQIPLGKRVHDVTAGTDGAHQVLLGKPEQRVAHRGSRDLQLLRQLVLDEVGVVAEHAVTDGVTQDPVDLFGERLTVEPPRLRPELQALRRNHPNPFPTVYSVYTLTSLHQPAVPLHIHCSEAKLHARFCGSWEDPGMTRSEIGVMFQRDLPPELIAPRARLMEQLGLDDIWITEDLFFSGGISAAYTALQATERLNVGIGILPALARNAVFTAMEFGVLSRLYPGRVLAGIGHGMVDWMASVGASVASPVTALEEHLRVVRQLLIGEHVTFRGRYVSVEDAHLEHGPEVPPPVFAGVRGPRSIDVSAMVADGIVLAEPTSPSYIRSVRERLDASGVGWRHQLACYGWLSVDDDAESAYDRASRASLEVSPSRVSALTWKPSRSPKRFSLS
jgi:alkanesulfonate monooxygenase SsuD/methylene tetrahydromethanopterin reductase-like flavin-dependent oxidoreductase (luciferase family)